MDQNLSLSFDAIGTRWVIDIYDHYRGKNLENRIEKIISDFSKIFSRFDSSSEISKASARPHKILIPKEYQDLVNLYIKLYKLTNGKFTPLIGNLLDDAGYDKDYSLKSKTLREVPKLDDVINFLDNVLEIKTPSTLDFGAAGKGFLVDLVSGLLESEKIKNYCIDAGGDILFKTTSENNLKVGLENPDDFSQVIGVCNLKNQSICGSAGNRRKWGEHHHIFDPDNQKSVEKIKAVWVISDKAYIADGLSTALFFTEPSALDKEFNFEYLIIHSDNQFKKSQNFPGEVFTS